jgi:transcriptional regulator with XRE-family HTH domain
MVRQWLKDIRLGKGLRQKDVAEKVGISQPSYWQIESGQCDPAVETAKKIAQELGADWTRFFQDDEERG